MNVLLTSLLSSATNTPIQPLIIHHLASLHPSPTPLAAAIVSSPLFHPFSYSNLDLLVTSFRHAVHSKFHALKPDSIGLFSQNIVTQLNLWSLAILQGLQGGHSIIRLACCTGLLLGLDDILQHLPEKKRAVKDAVEDELVITFADVIDHFSTSDSWGKEFNSAVESADALALSLVIASHSLLLVPSQKFTALPLSHLLGLIMRTIQDAFDAGNFLSSLQSSSSSTEPLIHIHPGSPIAKSINKISTSTPMTNMGSISKLCARTVSLFVHHRPIIALPQVLEAFQSLHVITTHVEADWFPSALEFSSTDETSLSPDARQISTAIWTLMKTLLFSVIMITEAGLSALVYVPRTSVPLTSSSLLAVTVLETLSHLSFVIAQFGGAGQGGFKELKRLFYLGLDVLGSDVVESNKYVRDLCLIQSGQEPHSAHPWYQSKKGFALSVIEQLIPVLSELTIRELVFPMCLPHLADASHRETFESAHSVVLAIFASHAQKGTISGENEFTMKMVPFYANCLIENSVHDRLSVTQLRLAFAALVRSAASGADVSLAWFCIDCVLSAIACSSEQDDERKHRLHLTLISCVPAVPLALLHRLLDPIRSNIDGARDEQKRMELIEALFAEIKERVGDQEKEFMVRWWGAQRIKWAHAWADRETLIARL